MSLSQKIAAAVDRELQPGAQILEAEDGPFQLRLDIREAGPVGLALNTLTFSRRTDPEHPLTPDAVQHWGDRICETLNYLMEPVKLHEFDRESGVVQLRSAVPGKRGSTRTYYELLIDPAGAFTLRRIRYDDDSRSRQPIPCQLTREMLERLVDDLEASAPAL